jgi:hypothetical protein
MDLRLTALNALHLVTFRAVSAGLLFSNDKRMIAAARRLHLPVVG